MSALYFVLQELVMTLEGVIHGFCFSIMLRPRRKNCPRIVQVLLIWSVYIATMSLSWITGTRIVGYVSLVISFILVQLMMKALYWESLKTRIWAWMLLYMMQALADLLGSFVYIVILGNETVNHMEDAMLPVLCTAVFLSFWLEFAAALFYSRRRSKGAEGKESFAVAAAAMLVILLYVLMLAYDMYFWQGNYTSAFMIISMFLAPSASCWNSPRARKQKKCWKAI